MKSFSTLSERQTLRSEGGLIPPTPAYPGAAPAAFKTPAGLAARPRQGDLLDAAVSCFLLGHCHRSVVILSVCHFVIGRRYVRSVECRSALVYICDGDSICCVGVGY